MNAMPHYCRECGWEGDRGITLRSCPSCGGPEIVALWVPPPTEAPGVNPPVTIAPATSAKVGGMEAA